MIIAVEQARKLKPSAASQGGTPPRDFHFLRAKSVFEVVIILENRVGV
jgi:hypothetical protein